MTGSVLAVLFRRLKQSATLCLIARCTPMTDLHLQMQLTTLSYAVTRLGGEQCHGTSGTSFCSAMARLRGLRSLPYSSGVAFKFICTGFLHTHTKRVMLMFAIVSLTHTCLQSLLSWKNRDCNPIHLDCSFWSTAKSRATAFFLDLRIKGLGRYG